MIYDSVSATIKLHYEFHLPEGAEKAPLLIAVHGYAAHMGYMMREAKLVAPEGFAIASIQGPNRFFRPTEDGQYKLAFGWLSDFEPQEQVALHHEFVLKVIDKHSEDGTIDPDRVFLYGFSQACALNFRFAFANPDALKGLVGVCGGIPGDLDTSDLYQPTNAEVFYLYGDDDEFYAPEKLEAFDKRLDEYLPSYQSRKYVAKHEISQEMRSDIRKWLAGFPAEKQRTAS
ncbi:MAG: hypothetical protein OEM82_15515 [Acidobacteriota bacterium]|nr:hypothetical protein [Acidobacteriota bacterium]MDH3528603.1 hypothetical protein [Acidobacteriota bacterium]